MLFLAGFRWSHCKILLLIYSCTICSWTNGRHFPNHQRINSSNPIIDISNYTLITLDCPVQYDRMQWYHNGRYVESNNSGSLWLDVNELEGREIFKCGNHNDPLETFSIVNVTIGRKPSQPGNLVCSGHLFEEASCSWTSGSQETNLPGTFIAQKKIRNAWVRCNGVSEMICILDRTDGLRIDVRVKEVNKFGSSKYAETYYELNKRVRPFPPSDLTLKHSSGNTILASWGTSEGWEKNYFYLEYQLQFRPISPLSVWEQTRELSYEINPNEFEGWNYYTTYEVQVRAKHYDADGYGDWSEPVNITTKEGYPTGQLALSYKEMESEDKDKKTYRNILLNWEVPDEMKARGKILGFEIRLFKWGIYNKAVNITDGGSTQYTFTNLLRDANYTMYVSAYNSISLSAPAILDVPVSLISSSYQAVVVAVMVCIVVIVILLLLAIGWIKIKKTEICLPLPEPKFNISEWQGIPIASAYVEGEVFDEIRSRKVVPTKNELDKLMRKLPDPSLKDTILELLISKCSIDHDWERMERRMERLLSNNTEISFVSESDEEEHLINNLSSVSENTALLNINGEALGKIGRCHSMPVLDKKITKDNNVKDVDAYSSGSEDTSGIGSDTSDQDVENEFHMKTSQSISDVKSISSLPSTSVDNTNVNISKSKSLSEKHDNAESLHEKCGYIKQNDVTKVVKSPANHQQNLQTTRQSSVSDYLDAAQMRQIQNNPRVLRQKRLMRKKPKSSGIGYVAVEDMPKIIAPKVPAGNISKPSVYIQHRELPALLSGASTSKIPKHLEVDQTLQMGQKSNLNSINHKLIEDQQIINSKSDTKICTKVTNAESHNVSVKTRDTLPTLVSPPPTLVSPYVKGSAKSSCMASNQSNTTDYVTLDKVGVSVSENTKQGVLPQPDSANWTSVTQNVRDRTAMSKNKKPDVSSGVQNINKRVIPKQSTKNRRQELQNFKEINLTEENPECKMSRVRIVNKSVLPKQMLQKVTTQQNSSRLSKQKQKCEPNLRSINKRTLQSLGPKDMQRPSGQTSSPTPFSTSSKSVPHKPSEVSKAQDISMKTVPKQNIQENHSKDYVPIQIGNTMAASSATQPTVQPKQKPRPLPASQRPCQKVVASKTHFQNQGVMMKGQFKSAKFVYSVSPSV